jgi:hypothetical protein
VVNEEVPAKRRITFRIDRLIADLGSERFRTRASATQELEKLGKAAESALREALHDDLSLETRRRISQLLDKLPPAEAELRYSDRLRISRAIGICRSPFRGLDGHLDQRDAVVTASPDRVVAEQGSVRCEGATAEPNFTTRADNGRLLHEGVEYRLTDGKLRGQKERTLPRPHRTR